jgi:hypothetical protein
MPPVLSLKFRLQMVTRIQHRQTVMRSPMDQNYHKSISKGSKTIQPVTKLKGVMHTQGTRAHAQNRNARIMHMRTMHDCCRKKPCAPEKRRIYESGRPPTHFWFSFQVDLTLKSGLDLTGWLVKDLEMP